MRTKRFNPSHTDISVFIISPFYSEQTVANGYSQPTFVKYFFVERHFCANAKDIALDTAQSYSFPHRGHANPLSLILNAVLDGLVSQSHTCKSFPQYKQPNGLPVTLGAPILWSCLPRAQCSKRCIQYSSV